MTEAMQQILRRVDTGYSSYTWEGLALKIRSLISLPEMMELTNAVMSACVHPDTQLFMPEMIDFVFRVHVLLAYTDIDLPDTVEDQIKLVYGTDLYHDVLEAINHEQVDAMKACVNLFAQRMNRGADYGDQSII